MSILDLTFFLLLAALLSVWVTGAVRNFALSRRFVDGPEEGLGRKQHAKPIPLLGGIAIFISFFSVIFILQRLGGLPAGYLHLRQFAALFLGGIVLISGGILDDRLNLPPRKQIIFPILAAAIAVMGGVHFTFMRNPLGGITDLGIWNLEFGIWNFAFPADIISFFWLLGMIYTTKLLDGLDGLATGISAIAAVLIAALALRPELLQLQTFVVAAALAAVLCGFLIWNFFPARIFLGEGGSTLLGFLIGAIAIAAGSKVATTLLVLGIPLLDVVAVIIRRWRAGTPVTRGGREHLHFRLLDAGISHRRVVLLYYLFSILFGGISWYLSTAGKLAAFVFLFVLFVAALAAIERRNKPV